MKEIYVVVACASEKNVIFGQLLGKEAGTIKGNERKRKNDGQGRKRNKLTFFFISFLYF
jgi:hypothetical protein